MHALKKGFRRERRVGDENGNDGPTQKASWFDVDDISAILSDEQVPR